MADDEGNIGIPVRIKPDVLAALLDEEMTPFEKEHYPNDRPAKYVDRYLRRRLRMLRESDRPTRTLRDVMG